MAEEKWSDCCDAHWNEVMNLARQYGFVCTSSEGVALLTDHATQLQHYGVVGYYKIQRRNGHCPKTFGAEGCLTDAGRPAMCVGCALALQQTAVRI